MTTMTATATAKDLTKAFEGLRLKAYECSADVWTIGYGHTGEMSSPEVYEGDEITLDQANDYFKSDWEEVEAAANRLLEVGIQKRRVTQERFDAFCAFLFNFGEKKAKNYTIVEYLNEGRSNAHLADYWVKYRVSNSVHLPGLLRRRMAELCVAHGLPWDVTQGEYEDRYTLDTHWQDVMNWALKSMHRRSQTNEPVEKKEPIFVKPKPMPKAEPVNIEVKHKPKFPDNYDAMTENQKTAWLNGDVEKIVESGGASVTQKVLTTKPIEQSKTAKGYRIEENGRNKADTGKNGALASGGILAVSGILEGMNTVNDGLKTAEGITKASEKTSEVVQSGISNQTWIAIVFGLLILLWVAGEIQKGYGRKKKEQGRAEATQAKI